VRVRATADGGRDAGGKVAGETVSGRVTDTSGGVLQGAAVELDPAGLTAGFSTRKASFTFTGVAAGKLHDYV